jgi:hypothetical protein
MTVGPRRFMATVAQVFVIFLSEDASNSVW